MKEETNKTWQELPNLVTSLFPEDEFPSIQFVVESAAKDFEAAEAKNCECDEGEEVYYIGQVLEVKNKGSQAEVTFMEQRSDDNCFKWPGSDKIDCIDSKYVFYSNFDIVPANRVWKIVPEHWSELVLKFRQYVQTFCRD